MRRRFVAERLEAAGVGRAYTRTFVPGAGKAAILCFLEAYPRQSRKKDALIVSDRRY